MVEKVNVHTSLPAGKSGQLPFLGLVLAEFPGDAARTIALVADALAILEQHPKIGRPVEQGLRELVISRGKSGYVALYQYDELTEMVVVLAVRHQREQGYH